MERFHFSIKEKILIKRIFDNSDRICSKAAGFWWSIGDSWYEWLKQNTPDIVGEYKYKVELSDDFQLLQINTPEKLIEFTAKYQKNEKGPFVRDIDWPSVTSKYDGIEILNYNYLTNVESCRYCIWIRSYDVDSGITWNLNKIKINKIK